LSKFKPVPKAPNSKNKQNDENKNLEADVKMPKKIWNFLFANKAAMWTAVFTGVLTLFTVKMWQVAWNNKTKLFLWGDVVYKDVFPGDPERLSENCIEISHLVAVASLGDPNVGLSGVSWKPRPKGLHICYDEDCKDYQDRIKDMRQ